MSLGNESRTLIIGLSGPSSSGKTTVARLLRSIFNIDREDATHNRSINLFILHEDDFYKTDKLIPRKTFTSAEHGTRELEDWDCVESLDLDLLESTLTHIKKHGVLPPDTTSKEDQNEIGESGVHDDTLKELQDETKQWLRAISSDSDSEQSRPENCTICILDGFLLYPRPPVSSSDEHTFSSSSTSSNNATTEQLQLRLSDILSKVLSVRLFIPSSRSLTITRRARRTGYVTLEGFWADPPGYVEDVVWPNYSADHAWMFNDKNRENHIDLSLDAATQENIDNGSVNWEIATKAGLTRGPDVGDGHMTEILFWAHRELTKAIENCA